MLTFTIFGIKGMAGHGRASHGCCATDYCIAGGDGTAPGSGRDFSIAHRAGEPSGGVRIILAYLAEPSAYAVARAMGVSRRTVTRCLRCAAELGVLAALDDRARPGRDARITAEARSQKLACRTGLREADAIWLPARAVDHPSAGSACAR